MRRCVWSRNLVNGGGPGPRGPGGGGCCARKKQEGHCTCDVTLSRVRITIVVEKQQILHYECTFVALGIQHAKRMRRIILSVACSAVSYFSTLCYKRHDFRETSHWAWSVCLDLPYKVCGKISHSKKNSARYHTGVLISPYRDQEGNKLHSPHFMELGGSWAHSQEPTTSPYPGQISPFLCPSHFWQAQLVSFLVGLWT